MTQQKVVSQEDETVIIMPAATPENIPGITTGNPLTGAFGQQDNLHELSGPALGRSKTLPCAKSTSIERVVVNISPEPEPL